LSPALDGDEWLISRSIRFIFGKEQVTNEWEAVWAPDPVWTVFERKFLDLVGIRTVDGSAFS